MTFASISRAFEVWGAAAVFLLVFLEYLGIPGYPGGLILPAIGILGRMELIGPFQGFLLAMISSGLAMALMYGVGCQWGGWIRKHLEQKKRWLEWYDRLVRFNDRYGVRGQVLIRMMPVIRTFSSIVSGMLGADFWPYWFYSMVGNGIYSGVVIALGYYVTSLFL